MRLENHISYLKLYVSIRNLYGNRQPSLKIWKDLGPSGQYELSPILSFRCSKVRYYASSRYLFTIPTLVPINGMNLIFDYTSYEVNAC